MVIILLVFASGCHSRNNDYKEIKELLSRRLKALEEGNESLYAETVSKNYHGKNRERKEDVLLKVRGIFDNTFSRKVLVKDQVIYLKGDYAEVVDKIVIRVKLKNGKEKILNGQEKLSLKKEESGWKIIGGL